MTKVDEAQRQKDAQEAIESAQRASEPRDETPEKAPEPEARPGMVEVSREALMIEDLGAQVASYSKEVSFWKTEARVAQAELAQMREELESLRAVIDEAMNAESDDQEEVPAES